MMNWKAMQTSSQISVQATMIKLSRNEEEDCKDHSKMKHAETLEAVIRKEKTTLLSKKMKIDVHCTYECVFHLEGAHANYHAKECT